MKSKRIVSTLLATAMAVSMNVFAGAQDALPFTDVKETEWFYGDVGLAYKLGLINGRDATTFAPGEMLTCAEAVKLAACMYQVYTNDAPFVASYDPWYQIYVDYCYEHGIINCDYNWTQPITRGAYMDIFSRALPADALAAINTVDNDLIPDVPMTYRYAQSIYTLYRAGIVQGIDETHKCSPDTYVTRSEVAAILTRMMVESSRLHFSLHVEETKEPDVTQNQTNTNNNTQNNQTNSSNQNNQSSGWIFPLYNPLYDNTVIPGGQNKNDETVNKPESGNNSSAGTGSSTNTPGSTGEETPELVIPWKSGGKQPSEYTWAEYMALTDTLKALFSESFENANDFTTWMNRAKGNDPDSVVIPWENGEKTPDQYTWAEFEALSGAQQMAFEKYFGEQGFAAWKDLVQGNADDEVVVPWDNGEKTPDQYTWAEFQALSGAQQMAFQKYLGEQGFATWKDLVQGNADGEVMPWNNPGAKQPEDYTWAEFEALSGAQQMAFQKYLGEQGFATWKDRVQENADGEVMPWNNPGAKQPEDYTWEDFESLTPGQTIAFQKYFDEQGFAAWKDLVQGNDGSEVMPWNNPGAKQPEDYTWADFDSLMPGQQIAFQSAFKETDGFKNWLTQNEP